MGESNGGIYGSVSAKKGKGRECIKNLKHQQNYLDMGGLVCNGAFIWKGVGKG